MKVITLQILKDDLLNTNFFNSDDCAITRALKRAGYNAHHTGASLRCDKYNNLLLANISQLMKLENKVIRMYKGLKVYKPLIAEDFKFDIEIGDEVVLERCKI